jgi:hypothetical protein
MTPHIPEELYTKIDRRPLAIMGSRMPPRDPNGDEENEDEEDEGEDDERTDQPPAVREPDED